MRVLVTGATGFIGNEIVSRLNDEYTGHYQVTGLARNIANKQSNVEMFQCDITDPKDVAACAEFIGHFDAVIHCAGLAHQFGKTPAAEFERVNVFGTENIADLAVRVRAKHFILISSTAVYGIQSGFIDEDSECHPLTPYANSKLEAELVCRDLCERGKVALTIFRLAPVLGAKGVGNIPRLIRAVDTNRFLWVGNGSNKKALIYVGDVAKACAAVLKQKKGSTEIFNLAAAPISMRELIDTISTTLGKRVWRVRVPASVPKFLLDLNSKTIGLRPLEKVSATLEKWLCDDLFLAEKIKTEYSFEPDVSLKTAIRMQCRWYMENQCRAR
jgi:nucleoside-diphosphate-sugar epimerase